MIQIFTLLVLLTLAASRSGCLSSECVSEQRFRQFSARPGNAKVEAVPEHDPAEQHATLTDSSQTSVSVLVKHFGEKVHLAVSIAGCSAPKR